MNGRGEEQGRIWGKEEKEEGWIVNGVHRVPYMPFAELTYSNPDTHTTHHTH